MRMLCRWRDNLARPSNALLRKAVFILVALTGVHAKASYFSDGSRVGRATAEILSDGILFLEKFEEMSICL